MDEPTGGRIRPTASLEAVAADDTGMTTGAVARRLGVPPTTLRSWDRRYGVGPAVRADGRHRRWTPRDVAMLEAMCRLTSAGVPPAEAARAAREGAARDGADTESRQSDGTRPVNAGQVNAGQVNAGPVREGVAEREFGPSPHDRITRPRTPMDGDLSPTAAALSRGDVRQECRGLARAAVRLDAPVIDERLNSAVERYGLTVAWQDVMVPTLHAVGRTWEASGDRCVEVEHLLSWHISTLLRRATPSPRTSTPETADGPVLLACVPGEQHTLPLEALNAGLAQQGLPTRMFGAAVPVEALTAAVLRLGPSAVVLWAQARSTASLPLARHVAGTHWGVRGARRHPLVVLGGPGWAGRSAEGMLRPPSLPDALTALAARYEGIRGRDRRADGTKGAEDRRSCGPAAEPSRGPAERRPWGRPNGPGLSPGREHA